MKRPMNLIPVLLGGDLNAYSVALSFKETYGICSHAFVAYKCGATEKSKFITTHVCSGLADERIAISELLHFASKHTGERLLLIPCSDTYLALLFAIKDILSDLYSICIPVEEHYRQLTDKSKFCAVLEANLIPTPKTFTIDSFTKNAAKVLKQIHYPAVLKPSESAEYWKHSFKGMEKVYFTKSEKEVDKILKTIKKSGYDKPVLLQQQIGNPPINYVLTTLSNYNGEVVRASLGKVVVEERGATSYGNHAAILSEPLDPLSHSLIRMLNRIGYKGVANFDIVSDGYNRYVLEMNARQGRSCDYLRGQSISLAEFFVKLSARQSMRPDFSYREIFWHYPRIDTVFKNLDDRRDEKRLRELIVQGRAYTPYKNDHEGIMRSIYRWVHGARLDLVFSKNRRMKKGNGV